jgi:hypothetical protein
VKRAIDTLGGEPRAKAPPPDAPSGEPPPIRVHGWIVYPSKKRCAFYWWCDAGRHWHGQSWDPHPKANSIRNAPHCFADGKILLVPFGNATREVLDAIHQNDSPPGARSYGPIIRSGRGRRLVLEQIYALLESGVSGTESSQLAYESELLTVRIMAYRDLSEVAGEGYSGGVRERDLDQVYSDFMHHNKTVKQAVGDLFPRYAASRFGDDGHVHDSHTNDAARAERATSIAEHATE